MAKSIEFYPKDTLTFRVKDDDPRIAFSLLTIRNPSVDENVAFKVKVTNPTRYVVKPNAGPLYAMESIEVEITMEVGDDDNGMDGRWGDMARDKFLVQLTSTRGRVYLSTAEFWKEVSASDMVSRKFNVVAGASDGPMGSREGSTRSFLSVAAKFEEDEWLGRQPKSQEKKGSVAWSMDEIKSDEVEAALPKRALAVPPQKEERVPSKGESSKRITLERPLEKFPSEPRIVTGEQGYLEAEFLIEEFERIRASTGSNPSHATVLKLVQELAKSRHVELNLDELADWIEDNDKDADELIDADEFRVLAAQIELQTRNEGSGTVSEVLIREYDNLVQLARGDLSHSQTLKLLLPACKTLDLDVSDPEWIADLIAEVDRDGKNAISREYFLKLVGLLMVMSKDPVKDSFLSISLDNIDDLVTTAQARRAIFVLLRERGLEVPEKDIKMAVSDAGKDRQAMLDWKSYARVARSFIPQGHTV